MVLKNDTKKMYIFQLYASVNSLFFFWEESKVGLLPSCCHFETNASKEIIFNHLTCAIEITLLTKGESLNFPNWQVL